MEDISAKYIEELFLSEKAMDKVKAVRLADKYGDRFSKQLINGLSDSYYEVRSYSCKSLGNIREKRANPKIIELLGDEFEEVRYRAAEALGKIQDLSSITPLLISLSDYSRETVYQATNSLMKFEQEIVGTHIIRWKSNIQDIDISMQNEESIKKIDVMRGIISACSRLTGDWIKEILEYGLFNADDEMVRLSSIVVGKKNVQSFLPRILELVNHEDDDIRLSAIYALSKLTCEKKADEYCKKVDDPSEFIRELISSDLYNYRNIPAVRDLILRFSEDPVPSVRSALIGSIGQIPEFNEIMLMLSSDPIPSVRIAVARALKKRNDEFSQGQLMNMYNKETDELTIIAITNAMRSNDG